MKPFDTYKTKHDFGFTSNEVKDMLEQMAPTITEEAFAEAMGVNTVITIEGEVVYYKVDIYTAIDMCINNRERKWYEFD